MTSHPERQAEEKPPSFGGQWADLVSGLGFLGLVLGLGFLVYWGFAWLWFHLTGRMPGISSPVGLLVAYVVISVVVVFVVVGFIVFSDAGPG